jgi:FkbM family methyltransferase
MNFKGIVKSAGGTTIRALSYSLPKSVLFHMFLRIRKLSFPVLRTARSPLASKAIDHLFYSLRPGVVEARIWDSRYFIRLNDPCHYDQLLTLHEPEVVQWLSGFFKAGMTFIDIGANIGFYSIMAAQRVGSSGCVVAVEADPDVAAILRQNIECNVVENVRIVTGAAYRECGVVKLGRAAASSWYSGLYYEKAAEWVAVPAFTLDTLLREMAVPRVDLVKMDVEGAEGAVLEGMARILREEHPTLLVELHGCREAGDAHPVIQQLKRAGYSIRRLTEGHVVGEPAKTATGDLGARPRSLDETAHAGRGTALPRSRN